MCLPNILFPAFMFAFIFHCRPFSPCWPLAFLIFSTPFWISMFFFLRNSSPFFSITRSSSSSVIHVSVNTKNNAEKDTTLLLSGRPCDFLPNKTLSCIWVAIPVDWVILHWYACDADGRSLARSVYGLAITKFSRKGRLPHFLSYGAPPRRGASRFAWSSAKNSLIVTQYVTDTSVNTCCKLKLVFLEERL